jgi:hypothetical protein
MAIQAKMAAWAVTILRIFDADRRWSKDQTTPLLDLGGHLELIQAAMVGKGTKRKKDLTKVKDGMRNVYVPLESGESQTSDKSG